MGFWVCGLGVLTGIHAASWGAYKDWPYEGFRWRSFVRSIFVGAVAGLIVSETLASYQPVVLIGLLYTMERLTTEWWKTFVRQDDQTAYSIPMQLSFRGRPVDCKPARYAIGSAVAVVLVGAGVLTSVARPTLPSAIPLLIVVGSAGGWLTACGGAWKDAPIEGFSGWKFLRSPCVATTWAVPISLITDEPLIVMLSAGGLAVASIETYKTFLTGGRPPGKFATKTIQFVPPRRRDLLATAHVALWGSLSVALITRIGQPLDVVRRVSVTEDSASVGLTIVAAGSAVVAMCVLGSLTTAPQSQG